MANVNYIFLLSLFIIALGYFLKRINIIPEENGKAIAKVIFNVTLPAVILKVTRTIVFSASLILLPLINILYGLAMALIALLVFKNYPKKLKGLLVMTMIGFNVAHFSFPLIDGIYGQKGMQYIALIDAGNAFTIFVVCYIFGSLFSHDSDSNEAKIDVKKLFLQLGKSTPLMTYIAALILNFSNAQLPMFILDLIDILYSANTPLSLLLLGIYLNFKFKKSEWINILKIISLRYTIGLLLGMLLFFTLPSTQFLHLTRLILTISLILPVGLAVILFSVEFEYDQELTTMITNLTIIISYALIWILILLLDG
ncbi:MAG: AEC family transporter [Promethearchaeota archaeon]